MMIRPDFSLDGKIAVVTGASRGIGAAVARVLAHCGAAVALLGRDAAALEARTAELTAVGLRALPFVVDVRDTQGVESTFARIESSVGRPDILINNAGMEEIRPALDVTEALWDRIIGTNLKGAFFASQAAAKRMSAGGSIVNICSLTSAAGVPGAAAYGASKSGLAGLTRALAAEWAGRGIRVNGIGPGYFRTAMTEPFYADDGWQRRMLPRIPLGRFGRLEDLGGAVVFLSSAASAYITGQILYVDGGMLAAL